VSKLNYSTKRQLNKQTNKQTNKKKRRKIAKISTRPDKPKTEDEKSGKLPKFTLSEQY
jgi:hypothetical protein